MSEQYDSDSDDEIGELVIRVAPNLGKGGPRKPQLPWRVEDKAQELYSCLFRLVVVEGLHLVPHKGVTAAWENFTELLFKQPEFSRYELVSAKTLRKQYDKYIEKRAQFHGWTDKNGGVTGNLSNHAGDLDVIDSNIRQILFDIEEKRAQKELKKALSEKNERTELEVLTQGITGASKKKRKNADGSITNKSAETALTTPPAEEGSVSTLSRSDINNKKRNTNGFLPFDSMLAERIFGSIIGGDELYLEERTRKKGTAAEAQQNHHNNQVAKLLKIFEDLENIEKGSSIATIAASISMEFGTEDYQLLNEIGYEVLVHSGFSSDESAFDKKYFEEEMNQYGMKKLHAVKLGLYLHKQCL
jgi:hypothetical protein